MWVFGGGEEKNPWWKRVVFVLPMNKTINVFYFISIPILELKEANYFPFKLETNYFVNYPPPSKNTTQMVALLCKWLQNSHSIIHTLHTCFACQVLLFHYNIDYAFVHNRRGCTSKSPLLWQAGQNYSNICMWTTATLVTNYIYIKLGSNCWICYHG